MDIVQTIGHNCTYKHVFTRDIKYVSNCIYHSIGRATQLIKNIKSRCSHCTKTIKSYNSSNIVAEYSNDELDENVKHVNTSKL